MPLLSTDLTAIERNSRLLWCGTAALFITCAAGLFWAGLDVEVLSNPAFLAVGAGYAAVAFLYNRIRSSERLAMALTAVAQLVLMMLFGILLSYAVTTIDLPYRDAELLALDRWLGFDRTSYVGFFTDQPWKMHATDLVYFAMLPQLAIVPLLLIITDRIERLQQFVAAYCIALVVTVAIFLLVPAVGAFVYFDLTPAQYAALPKEVYTPARTLDLLRSGAFKTISLNNLEGLVAFPSFHTIASILYAWALRPIRLLRWPVVLLNTGVILTTPIGGAHYVVDLLAGFAVAVISIALSRRLLSPLLDAPQFSMVSQRSLPMAQT